MENRPVVLYRLRGEPSLSLMYVSNDIARFGHDRDALLASRARITDLVDPGDRTRVDAALARVLERSCDGASVECRMQAGYGTYRWGENRFIPVRDGDGRLIEVDGILLDMVGKEAMEEHLARLAGTDALTGLANRATFLHRLRRALAAAQRGAMPFAVFPVDIDHFGSVRDTLGQAVGDLLLQEVAKRLTACTGELDLDAMWEGCVRRIHLRAPSEKTSVQVPFYSSRASCRCPPT